MFDNTARTFWISFFTSLLVSLVVSVLVVVFVVPNLPFLQTEKAETNKIEVPQLEGINFEKAKIMAMNKNLGLFVEGEKPSSDEPKGNILSQSPMAGAMIEKNSVINVIISAGKEITEEVEPVKQPEEVRKITMPHYIGLNIDDVQRQIIDLGLKIGEVNYEESEKYGQDVVVKTVPPSGTEIAEGAYVNIFVSKGVGNVSVPDVFRLSKSSAISKIKAAGLIVKATNYTTDVEYPFDIVIRQDPAAGSKVKKGSGVTIWINTERY